MASHIEGGKLILVPTPIGNLEDLTFRAVRVLKEVDIVLAEDTRITRVLFRHYDIHTPLQAYHQHNEHARLSYYIELLQSGKRLALVSDAGTPSISDPGFLLVREALRYGLSVEALPGACAAITSVVVSGLPCERFIYEGFLPVKKGRASRLDAIAHYQLTTIIYESSHRIVRLLEELQERVGGERGVVLCRELTKMYEEVLRGSLADVLATLQSRATQKGEFVLVLSAQTVE